MTLLYIALPVALFLVTRSLTRTTLTIGVIFAFAGGLLQFSVSSGASWTLSGVQWLVLACFIAALAAGWWQTRTGMKQSVPRSRQVKLVVVPAVVIGAFFLVMRLIASPDPGPLAGIGFLVSHGAAEDNAKWMNLASHLASGEPLSFAGGYAGGPYLLVLAVVTTALAALSQLLFGGLNEVAVVTGTVIGTSFLLSALVPFAFAPLAERSWKSPEGEGRSKVPGPLLWAGMLVLVAASINAGGIGHQSLQLVMVMLALWAATFLAGGIIARGRLLAVLIAAGAGVVWFPLNLWALAIIALLIGWLAVTFVTTHRTGGKPPWVPAALILLAVVSYWDGLVSSTLYALGLDGGTSLSALGAASAGVTAGVGIPANTASLFSSPGGTEEATAYLTMAALAAALAAGVWLNRMRVSRKELTLSFLPLGSLVAYAALIAVGDAVLTGVGTNYATLKMTFLVTVVLLASTVPLGLMNLDPNSRGMNSLRWVGVGGVVFLLVADSLLARAVAAVGPLHWAAPEEDSLPYWATFEVKPVADQPVESLPIACVFLPPGADKPTGNVDGQLAYACTRMLIGLSGAEGNVGSLMDWLTADWLANGSYWNEWYANLEGTPEDIRGRQVVLLDDNKRVIGFETLEGLLNRFPPEESNQSG